MKRKVFRRAVPVAAVLALVFGTAALAQDQDHARFSGARFSGAINDYTPASTGGPWEVRGHWSLELKRHGKDDCKADFSAALTMERSDLGVIKNGGGDLDNPMDRMAHTHHIKLVDGEVTSIPGGIQVTGPATVTANGAFPPPFGSDLPTITIEITGGAGENSIAFSNITLLFGAPAAGHFGTHPLHGVVVRPPEREETGRR